MLNLDEMVQLFLNDLDDDYMHFNNPYRVAKEIQDTNGNSAKTDRNIVVARHTASSIVRNSKNYKQKRKEHIAIRDKIIADTAKYYEKVPTGNQL